MTLAAAVPGPVRDRPTILCVDDEPLVLEGIQDALRRSFDVWTAASGPEALELLTGHAGKFAVLVSDLRMPKMSGANFLRLAQPLAPDSVKMLLTGAEDLQEALQVVNSAQLFRFLTKPCDSEELRRACAAALGQHRMKVAERELLEQTLRGSVTALSEAMAMAIPAAFGRSRRIAPIAAAIAQAAGLTGWWEVEVAASLADLGAVALSPATAEKVYSRQPLTEQELEEVSRVPLTTRRLLGKIPRLEGVLAILEQYQAPESPSLDSCDEEPLPGAQILQMVSAFDELVSEGIEPELALAIMRSRGGFALVDVLASVMQIRESLKVAEVSCSQLRAGMTLADDARGMQGNLLVARGEIMTDQLIDRLVHMPPGHVLEPLRVILDDCGTEATDDVI